MICVSTDWIRVGVRSSPRIDGGQALARKDGRDLARVKALVGRQAGKDGSPRVVLDNVAEAPLELLHQHRVSPAVERGGDSASKREVPAAGGLITDLDIASQCAAKRNL
jgi:hypothetical protein